MYLMITIRSSIAFAIGKLSQRNQNPRAQYRVAVNHVLRYINRTRDFGILYNGYRTLSIDGYSDAAWGGSRKPRNSNIGSIFLVSGGAVSWRSNMRTYVATSTCEAECIASSLAAKESI